MPCLALTSCILHQSPPVCTYMIHANCNTCILDIMYCQQSKQTVAANALLYGLIISLCGIIFYQECNMNKSCMSWGGAWERTSCMCNNYGSIQYMGVFELPLLYTYRCITASKNGQLNLGTNYLSSYVHRQ